MYTIKSHTTRVNTAFERISKGNYLDVDLKPYTRKFINETIEYFERNEEYEKCQILKDALINLDHEKNYTRWKPKQ